MTCVLLAARDLARAQRWAAELAGLTPYQLLPAVTASSQARELLARHQPALLITELQLLDGFAGDLIRSLQYRPADRRVLTLALHRSGQDPQLLDALQAGANNFLALDDAQPVTLAQAAQYTLAGGAQVAPWVGQRLLEHFGAGVPSRRHTVEDMASPLTLSHDERELLRSLAGGQTIAELAAELGQTAQAMLGQLRTINRKVLWMLRAGDLTLC